MVKSPKFFLEKLMSLPHRGNGTPELARAAEIIFNEHKTTGFDPKYVEFRTAEASFFKLSFTILLFLFSAIMKWFGLEAGALFFYILGWMFYLGRPTVWEWISIRFRSFLAKSVFVEITPVKETKNTIAITGHYDSGKVAKGINILRLINNTSLGEKLFSRNEKVPAPFRGPFFLTNIAIILLGLGLLPFPVSWFKFIILLVSFLILLASFIVNLHIALSPAVPGAFDNGSGTAAVMALAASFINKPLQNTRLIFLTNPSEEGFTDGFSEFFQKAKIDKNKTHFIVLDGVGAKNLKIAYGETGHALGMARYCDRKLYNIASQLIKDEKRFGSIKEFFLPVQSDATNIINKGGKVGLIVVSLDDHGFVDHYHQMSDTIDKINFEIMDLCHDFVAELVKKIDGFLSLNHSKKEEN